MRTVAAAQAWRPGARALGRLVPGSSHRWTVAATSWLRLRRAARGSQWRGLPVMRPPDRRFPSCSARCVAWAGARRLPPIDAEGDGCRIEAAGSARRMPIQPWFPPVARPVAGSAASSARQVGSGPGDGAPPIRRPARSQASPVTAACCWSPLRSCIALRRHQARQPTGTGRPAWAIAASGGVPVQRGRFCAGRWRLI